jgi:hypothetical protein
MNVGMQMGPKSGGLTDVDLDCPEALKLAKYFLPRTASKYGRPSKRRSHWLYTCSDPHPRGWYKFTDENKAVIAELRLGGGGKGSQSVAPGCVHTGGEHYEWDEDDTRAAVACDKLLDAVKKIAAATILSRHWPASNRNDAALRVGGLLARTGWDAEAIGWFMVAVQEVAGVHDPSHVENGRIAAVSAVEQLANGGNVYGLPGMSECFGDAAARQIAKIIGYRSSTLDIQNNEQVLTKVDEINENYALVLAGDKAVVMRMEGKSDFRLIKVSAFRQWHANQQILIGNKMAKVSFGVIFASTLTV